MRGKAILWFLGGVLTAGVLGWAGLFLIGDVDIRGWLGLESEEESRDRELEERQRVLRLEDYGGHFGLTSFEWRDVRNSDEVRWLDCDYVNPFGVPTSVVVILVDGGERTVYVSDRDVC